MIMQERRVREKIGAQYFYTISLKPELHPICQGNLSLTLHNFKRFTKFTLLHFQNKQNTYQTLLNHTRITTTQQDTSCRPRKPPGTHTKLKKDQTSLVAQPWLPQTPSLSFKHKLKAPRIDQRSIFNSGSLNDHERARILRFLKQFRTRKCSCYLSFKNHNTYSQTVTKFNRLISKSIG